MTTSAQLFDLIFNKITLSRKENRDNLRVDLLEPLENSRVYGAIFTANQQSFALMSPATNFDELDQVLQRVNLDKAQKAEWQFIIPFYDPEQQHWLTLVVQAQSACLMDSRSMIIAVPEALKTSLAQAQLSLDKEEKENDKIVTRHSALKVNKGSDAQAGYCAAIVTKMADFILDGKGEHLDSLSSSMQSPDTSAAIQIQSATACYTLTDRQILENRAILEAREEKQLNNSLDREQLLKLWGKAVASLQPEAKSDSEVPHPNVLLYRGLQEKLFEVGCEDFSNLHKDLDRNPEFYFNGVHKSQCFEKGHPKQVVTAESLKNALGCTLEEANQVAQAHSQGPQALIPFIVDGALLSDGDERSIRIKQPESAGRRLDLIYSDKQFKLVATFQQFPIRHYDTGQLIGWLDGPVTLTFDLAQNAANQWGWLLNKIDSDNIDIMRMAIGQMLPEQYILALYTKYASLPKSSPSDLCLVNVFDDGAQHRIQALNAENELLKQGAQSSVGELNKQVRELTTSNTNYDLQITRYKSKVSFLETQAQRLEQANESLKKTLAAATDRIDNLSTANNKKDELLEQKNSDNTKLAQAVLVEREKSAVEQKAHEATVRGLTQDLNTAQTVARTLREQLEKTTINEAKLTQQLLGARAIAQENVTLKEQLSEAQSLERTLRQQLITSQAAARQAAELRGQLVTATQELGTARTTARNLRGQLSVTRARERGRINWWKVALAGAMFMFGVAAVAFGVSALLGVVLMGKAVAITLTAIGGATMLSAGSYTSRIAKKERALARARAADRIPLETKPGRVVSVANAELTFQTRPRALSLSSSSGLFQQPATPSKEIKEQTPAVNSASFKP